MDAKTLQARTTRVLMRSLVLGSEIRAFKEKTLEYGMPSLWSSVQTLPRFRGKAARGP
jgi:hypothetical protein